MDLVYTTYQGPMGRGGPPPWAQETNSVCSVSCQNLLLFSSALKLGDAADRESRNEGAGGGTNKIYCVDLNSPWDYSLVCTMPGTVYSLTWDGAGTKFAVGDSAGNMAVWKMSDFCISEWEQVYSAQLPYERILKCGFLASSRGIRLNPDKKDALYYNDKFQFGPQVENGFDSEVCIFVAGTGLLTAVVFDQSAPFNSASACVGRSRSRIEYVDIATSTSGHHMLAVSGAETPVTVYTVHCSLSSQECGGSALSVVLTNHSSFCVSDKAAAGQEAVRISALKFLLSESSDAITVGVDGSEGGKVRMWELDYTHQSCHKLFSHTQPSPKRKLVPGWRYCTEFSGAGAKLVGIATPRSSIMSGAKPSCYVAAAFADGSIQCLIRDSLHQIASVELPRGGNVAKDSSKIFSSSVTICDMCFTSTGTGLVVTDSLGQLYLYRMSPIADPGGPHVAPYLVTMYEYCLISGRDWWDLALAAAQTNIQTITDKLEETFQKQPAGVRNFCYYRYMAIRSSLFRIGPQSYYRAADTLSMMMLRSIYGDLSSLLNVEGAFMDQDPADKLSSILRNCPSTTELDTVVSSIVSTGYVRDLPLSSEGTQNLQQLGNWVITLALHVLSAVPEFKTRRGPGFWLMQEGGLGLVRDILVMLRLWALPKPSFITREKELDLNSKLFSMIGRLKDKPEDENLLDECLILPSTVIVPGLDVMVSPTGVLAGLLAGHSLPFSFRFGAEPNFYLPSPPPFIEGLPYTEDAGAKVVYDVINKVALGRSPAKLRRCNRCRSHTQVVTGKGGRSWETRWNRNCFCGGSWRILDNLKS